MIDDDADDGALVEVILRKTIPRLSGIFLPHGAAAVDALEKSADRPNLILCDLKMPVMDGFEFLLWRRSSRFRSVPVVIRSGSALQEDVNRAYELGANSYMVKSVLMEEARAQFQSIALFWTNCCEVPPNPGSDRPLARRLFSAPDSVYLARHLRIAFTDGELEILEHDHVFQSAFASANDTPDDARLLVKLGGAVLAARKQQRLRLQKSSDE